MNELLKLLTEDEGRIPYVYDDATGKPIVSGYTVIGNPTIGVGRLITKDNPLTDAEIDYLFGNSVQTTITELDDSFPWFGLLDSVRSDVVVSMAFNLGVPRFKKFRNTIAAIRAQNWQLASIEILDSKAARDLPRRYHKLAKMMLTGERQ